MGGGSGVRTEKIELLENAFRDDHCGALGKERFTGTVKYGCFLLHSGASNLLRGGRRYGGYIAQIFIAMCRGRQLTDWQCYGSPIAMHSHISRGQTR